MLRAGGDKQKEGNVPDRELKCVDCGETFMFDSKEQEYFKKKGYEDPKRCKDCRKINREKREREA